MSDLPEEIANHATTSEKNAWQRKKRKMNKLMEELTPIEEELLDLKKRKDELVDQITLLRQEMVKSCIHPSNMVIEVTDQPGVAVCKFCDTKVSLPNVQQNE